MQNIKEEICLKSLKKTNLVQAGETLNAIVKSIEEQEKPAV